MGRDIRTLLEKYIQDDDVSRVLIEGCARDAARKITAWPEWIEKDIIAALSNQPPPQQQEQSGEAVALTLPLELHTRTKDLVVRFASALAEKLYRAEEKYGYSDGWIEDDWLDECRDKLNEHVAKGDPRDVAAYCAFLWHHGSYTAAPTATASQVEELSRIEAMVAMLEEGEWAEHVGGTYPIASRLEAAITQLHNELRGEE